jgi:ribA/ribD-fused uncharacterized protein
MAAKNSKNQVAIQAQLPTFPNENVTSFTKVALPFGWMGNMSPHPVTYNGKNYRTTESLFQCLRVTDETVAELIRAEKSPMAAKMVAKRYKESRVVEQGSERDLENMRLCLRLKVDQHPDLKAALLATGDTTIVEDTTNRNKIDIWGAKLKDGVWVGENVLGKLWMELREKLRE